MTPAESHRRTAAGFTDRVEGVPDWGAPAPVEGWTALDVVDHLVTWLPGFLSGGGVELPAGPPTSDDPVTAWRHHADAVQALLDSPRATEPFTHPHAGTRVLGEVVDDFYVADVFMHTWDLARASGQDDTLDPQRCEAMLAGMRPIEEMLRGSGQYGPAMPVADDAPAHDRLMAFVGRDPDWHPGLDG